MSVIKFSTKLFFSSFVSKGKETFTPKITKSLNKTFQESFPISNEISSSPSANDLKLKFKTSNLLNSNYNFIQPDRTYREELYASRRFELNPSQNPNYAFRRLQSVLLDENIPTKVREKKHFVRPGLIKHAIIYAGRRKKFNNLVRETIKKVINIHKSQK